MKSYTAEDFKDPMKFITLFDRGENKQQYNKGLQLGQKAEYIAISIGNVWSAKLKNGGDVSSYEKIGYHSGTADLLRGFLDSKCTLKVYRETEDGIVMTEIK